MRQTKQTLNAKRSRLNAQFRHDSKLDVGRWMLGVGRFPLTLR
jgi:hypothetical protein